ncbi:MAG: FKBP-type peptidyl-prolyl cis-trans isomerase [Desulfosarcina sp.]|nr:FKBP-type peptidyl-prolyl cis-trans isomerase [Desulfobacterales bacterium]
MTQAKAGDKVSVHYIGKLDDGSVFDSSMEPIEFEIGKKTMLPSFENSLIGMKQSESKTITIPPGDAYGEYNDKLVFVINRSDLPPDFVPQKGKLMQGRSDHGDVIDACIKGIDDEKITMDANHELAGKRLTFEITLMGILFDEAQGGN